jgi:hypothetical protein
MRKCKEGKQNICENSCYSCYSFASCYNAPAPSNATSALQRGKTACCLACFEGYGEGFDRALKMVLPLISHLPGSVQSYRREGCSYWCHPSGRDLPSLDEYKYSCSHSFTLNLLNPRKLLTLLKYSSAAGTPFVV